MDKAIAKAQQLNKKYSSHSGDVRTSLLLSYEELSALRGIAGFANMSSSKLIGFLARDFLDKNLGKTGNDSEPSEVLENKAISMPTA